MSNDTTIEVPSRQEMFNRAWLGLKSQGFVRAYEGTACQYKTTDGKRCAWGWVDPEGTSPRLPSSFRPEEPTRLSCQYRADGNLIGGVSSLRELDIGLAGKLNGDDFRFAQLLQAAHDTALAPAIMIEKLTYLATQWGLTIPADQVES